MSTAGFASAQTINVSGLINDHLERVGRDFAAVWIHAASVLDVHHPFLFVSRASTASLPLKPAVQDAR